MNDIPVEVAKEICARVATEAAIELYGIAFLHGFFMASVAWGLAVTIIWALRELSRSRKVREAARGEPV